MKKYFKNRGLTVFLCLLLAVSLIACSQPDTNSAVPEASPSVEATQALYAAGTYEGNGEGRNGQIVVSVTLSDEEITNIEIVSHSETQGISDPAFERIPAFIVEHQSLAVDTVSGCTMSSNGILQAIENALTAAKADVGALKARTIEKSVSAPIEVECDVVVIGGGGAGMAAMAAAAQNGANVLLLEKTAALGGNTLQSGCAWNAADPALQSTIDTQTGQLDVLKSILEYDESDFGAFAETLTTLKGQIKEYLAGDTSKMFDSIELHMIQTYTGGKRKDRNGEWIEGDFELIQTLCTKSLETIRWMETLGTTFQTDYLTTPSGSMWLRGHAATENKVLFTYPEQYLLTHGGQIMLETRAEELIMENGAVSGVKATKLDGTPVTVKASKGVIMATGGFASNRDMCIEYNTYWPELSETLGTSNVNSSTGDGIIMGLSAGADLVGMGFLQITLQNFDAALVTSENFIYVNKEGVRYVNEYSERDVRAFATLEQTDGMGYFVVDHAMALSCNDMLSEEELDTKVQRGSMFRSDTLEGLAEFIGCDPAVLVETVEKYNSYVEAGKDPDFGKPVFKLKIETAPFYAYTAIPAAHHTMGGLRINKAAQVLKADGTPITGLYAAGEVTGGTHGGNRLGGNAIADCFTFGKIAGENAATR